MSASIHSRRYAEHRELQSSSREVQGDGLEVYQEAREVRGAEKRRAVPLRREVLRAAGVPNGAAWSEALRRGSDGDAEARAKHRAMCQHGGRAWVQGPIVSIVQAFGRRSRVWTV